MLNAFANPARHNTPQNFHDSDLAYIEAWQPDHPSSSPKGNALVVKPLENSQLQEWAWRKNGQKTPAGLRLLMAQPKSQFRENIPSILLSARVLEALHLPCCTFTSFQQPSGVFSVHTYPEGSTPDKCTRLGLVFRSPQKAECCIGGFAVSHDFDNGITTALIVGNWLDLGNVAFRSNSSGLPPPLENLILQLQDCQYLWAHPLLLPCLLLIAHARLARGYIMGKVSNDVNKVERSIGVTKAGSMSGSSETHIDFLMEDLFVDGKLQRERAKVLTQVINNLSRWIIFTQRSPQWNLDSIEFLKQLLVSSTRLEDYRGITAETFRETLDYVQSYTGACLEVTQTAEVRMKLQLDILHTSVAQDDGQISARMAVSAGRDSTSMKIIALITAAYLPAMFVATLFSTGMFQWKESSQDDNIVANSTVSPDFRIYWAVAVPLTFITLLGWATWWKFEEHRFMLEIQQAGTDRRRP